MKSIHINSQIFMGILLLIIVFFVSKQFGLAASGTNALAGKEKPVVVIDAGHGASHLRTNK